MRRLLKYAVVAIVPFGIPVAVGVWILRRVTTKNAVVIVKPPTMPVLRVMNGGKS